MLTLEACQLVMDKGPYRENANDRAVIRSWSIRTVPPIDDDRVRSGWRNRDGVKSPTVAGRADRNLRWSVLTSSGSNMIRSTRGDNEKRRCATKKAQKEAPFVFCFCFFF